MRTLTVEKIGETEKAVQYRVTFWIVENPGHPVCWEGSVSACRSDLCMKYRDKYIRENGKLPQGESIYLRQAKK